MQLLSLLYEAHPLAYSLRALLAARHHGPGIVSHFLAHFASIPHFGHCLRWRFPIAKSHPYTSETFIAKGLNHLTALYLAQKKLAYPGMPVNYNPIQLN
jgi:hypothetical protein